MEGIVDSVSAQDIRSNCNGHSSSANSSKQATFIMRIIFLTRLRRNWAAASTDQSPDRISLPKHESRENLRNCVNERSGWICLGVVTMLPPFFYLAIWAWLLVQDRVNERPGWICLGVVAMFPSFFYLAIWASVQMDVQMGMKVEVSCDDNGFEEAWYEATVIDVVLLSEKLKFSVRYDHFITDEWSREPLVEEVFLE